MKNSEPRVMRELHEIRAKHYEETKHMSFSELAKSINEEAERVMKEYGLSFKKTEKH